MPGTPVPGSWVQSAKVRSEDLTLAHIDGAQTFHQTLGIHPQVPVLLLSSLDEHETRRRIRGLGVAGYLTKPFKLEALRDTLQKILP